MPIRDTAAMNSSLNNDYGSTAGPNAPSTWELALYVGDPIIDEVDGGGVEADSTSEVASPGYGRVALDQADFAPAVDGTKKLNSPAVFPDPTGEWEATVTHWALFAGSSSVMWDCGPIVGELDVTSAGDGPTLDIVVFYDDNVTEPA